MALHSGISPGMLRAGHMFLLGFQTLFQTLFLGFKPWLAACKANTLSAAMDFDHQLQETHVLHWDLELSPGPLQSAQTLGTNGGTEVVQAKRTGHGGRLGPLSFSSEKPSMI